MPAYWPLTCVLTTLPCATFFMCTTKLPSPSPLPPPSTSPLQCRAQYLTIASSLLCSTPCACDDNQSRACNTTTIQVQAVVVSLALDLSNQLRLVRYCCQHLPVLIHSTSVGRAHAVGDSGCSMPFEAITSEPMCRICTPLAARVAASLASRVEKNTYLSCRFAASMIVSTAACTRGWLPM